MSLIRELRRRAVQATGPTLAALMVGYFIFHLVQGDRGILAWLALRQQIDHAEAASERIGDDRARVEARVAALRPDRLDADMLDERARRLLGFVADGDIVIYENRGLERGSPGR